MERLVDFLITLPGPMPYVIAFSLLLLCGLGLPMPEDITLFAAAILSYYGAADVRIMILTCFAGVMIGDSFVFFMGYKYGPRLLKKKFFKRILPPHRLELVKYKLHKQGNKVIFAARFMPGFRTPMFFSAGLLHLPARVFFFYDGLAALISVPTIIYAVYYFGEHLDRVIKIIKRIQFGIVGLIAIVVIIVGTKLYYEFKRQRKEEARLEKEVNEHPTEDIDTPLS